MSNKTKALKKEIKKEENLVKKILETLSNGDVRAYRGNPLLKRQGEVIEFTAAHVKEYKRCAKDPVYFAEKYIKIVHVDKGLIPIRLYDYQKKLIELCHKERFVITLACRQSGKCCGINTIITLRHTDLYDGEEFSISIGAFYQWRAFIKTCEDLLTTLSN
jgi:hypothetical protein